MLQLAGAIQRWIMRAGAVRATIVVTLVSIIASVAMSWMCLVLLGATDVPLQMWLVAAIVAPLSVAPIMFGVVISMAYQLATAKAALARAAATDPLTGVANRRSFIENSNATLAQLARENRTPSLLLLDVDHFKTINDRFGHAVGDAVLVEVAKRCAARLGTGDLFARLGGEEFVALVTRPDHDAHIIAEMLRREVALIDIDGSDEPLGVTVSIGISGGTHAEGGIASLLAEADRQLYAAKHAGRNRVAGDRAA